MRGGLQRWMRADNSFTGSPSVRENRLTYFTRGPFSILHEFLPFGLPMTFEPRIEGDLTSNIPHSGSCISGAFRL
jgi:hypothetical protein